MAALARTPARPHPNALFPTPSKKVLLHVSIYHPTHTIKAIPRGQFIRIRHNCFSFTDSDRQAIALETKLCKCCYNKSNVRQACIYARRLSKTNLFTQCHPKSTGSTSPLVFSTRYSLQFQEIILTPPYFTQG